MLLNCRKTIPSHTYLGQILRQIRFSCALYPWSLSWEGSSRYADYYRTCTALVPVKATHTAGRNSWTQETVKARRSLLTQVWGKTNKISKGRLYTEGCERELPQHISNSSSAHLIPHNLQVPTESFHTMILVFLLVNVVFHRPPLPRAQSLLLCKGKAPASSTKPRGGRQTRGAEPCAGLGAGPGYGVPIA